MGGTYSTSGVLATDHADIVLASHGTSALLIGGDLGNKRVVGLLTIPVAAALITLHLSGNVDGSPLLAGTIAVDHA